jgi:hypothetical protein
MRCAACATELTAANPRSAGAWQIVTELRSEYLIDDAETAPEHVILKVAPYCGPCVTAAPLSRIEHVAVASAKIAAYLSPTYEASGLPPVRAGDVIAVRAQGSRRSAR